MLQREARFIFSFLANSYQRFFTLSTWYFP